MNLSTDLQEVVESTGAKVRFRFPWWLRPFLFGNVVAITLGKRVYLAADTAGEQLERLLRHELAHVRQALRLGILRFWWLYVGEYVRNRRAGLEPGEAYRRISFEIEAFAAEEHLQPDV